MGELKPEFPDQFYMCFREFEGGGICCECPHYQFCTMVNETKGGYY